MKKTMLFASLMMMAGVAMADCCASMTVQMNKLLPEGKFAPIGTVTLEQTQYGVVLTPNLEGLTPGLHGFHVHTNPSCDPATKNGKVVLGGAAGGHFDPMKAGKHGMPWQDDAHLGDMPPLFVGEDGKAVQPVLAPRLTLQDVKGHSLMIHAGGDNHSDNPKPLGGGGARFACGIVK